LAIDYAEYCVSASSGQRRLEIADFSYDLGCAPGWRFFANLFTPAGEPVSGFPPGLLS
jgi:hypothetical protein